MLVGRLKDKTDLATHSCKRLRGYITSCNAPAQAGVVLVFEVYKKHSNLRLVRRRGSPTIFAHRLFYRARTLQYKIGCCALCKPRQRERRVKGNRTETGFERKGIVKHFNTLVACFVAGEGCAHTVAFCCASAVV